MKKGVGVIALDPVSWDVLEVNRKVREYQGDLKEACYSEIYSPSAYALLTNRVLKSRWKFLVVSTLTVMEDDGEVSCTTCELEYKLNQPTLFKEGADILMQALIPVLREEFNNKEPDTLLVTGSGNITVGNLNEHANRSRAKAKRKR